VKREQKLKNQTQKEENLSEQDTIVKILVLEQKQDIGLVENGKINYGRRTTIRR